MIYTGHAGYLDDHRATVGKIADRLKGHSRKYDVIVATGLSGVLVASPLSLRLRKPLVVIRKEDEKCHAFSPYVNAAALTDKRYLFIDDFISLGATYDRIRRLCEVTPHYGIYAGCYLYNDDVLSWDGDGIVEYTPDAKRKRKIDINYNVVAEQNVMREVNDLGTRQLSYEEFRKDLLSWSKRAVKATYLTDSAAA